MRHTGVTAHGVRLPIITAGDDLPEIVAESVAAAAAGENFQLKATDIIGVTEAIVAKAQGNYARVSDVAADISAKFGGNAVGVVFPILSRNRFMNILKGIAAGASKVYVLLSFPDDEFGNPIMDSDLLDDLDGQLSGPVPAARFRELTGNFVHPFTGVDYISLYESAGDNVEVFLSTDARDILKLTEHVLVAEVHSRDRAKKRLLKAGAETVYTLSDVLSAPVGGSGFNPDYGVLGSNLSKDDQLKLFPRDCDKFVAALRGKLAEKCGSAPEVLVYGDGAFKDPVCGIWELADPVVSPAYTERLAGQPNEIKLKFVADNVFNNLDGDEKQKAIEEMIRQKKNTENNYSAGTTPRKYADLVGSLCDLMSGSGDKGTPVIVIRGYFDDYSDN